MRGDLIIIIFLFTFENTEFNVLANFKNIKKIVILNNYAWIGNIFFSILTDVYQWLYNICFLF